MKIEHAFEVPATPEHVWVLLMNVPRIIPCMPGATLEETIDESHWKATMNVRLGAISLNFVTNVEREPADEAGRRTRLVMTAREARGRGNAQATIDCSITSEDHGSRVEIITELVLSGVVAQYGRGIVTDVSQQLVESFADCLKKQLAKSPAETREAVAARAPPVSGLRLGVNALLRELGRLFRRVGR